MISCFSTRTRTGLWVLLCALGGCALTDKSDPLEIRYFTPQSSGGSAPAQTAVPAAAESLGLSLGRVRASAYLRERIAFRASANELGFYEGLRWTERPESYLRRALSSSLFEQRGLEQVLAGPGATLEVELISFEETREPASFKPYRRRSTRAWRASPTRSSASSRPAQRA